MRSKLVFEAARSVPNRYLLMRLISAATRRFHRPNTRIEETMNDVLVRVRQNNPFRATGS